MQLISKCGIKCRQKIDTTVKHYDYSKSHIIESVEQSLKNLQTDYLDVFLLQTRSVDAGRNCRSGWKLKSEGKIIDFGLSIHVFTNGIDTSKNRNSYNQVQFSATNFEPMLDGSFDYMQMHIRPDVMESGCVFRKDIPQTHRLKNYGDISFQIPFGFDTILLSCLKHPSK
jgi:predicted oxidoreductase